MSPKELFPELNEDIIEVEDEKVELDKGDLQVVNFGIPAYLIDSWSVQHDDSPFTKKGTLRKAFFEFCLERLNIVDLRLIRRDKLPSNLQDLLDRDIENKTHENESTDNLIETSKLLSNAIIILRWLYNFMGENMQLKKEYEFTEKDLGHIDDIEIIIGENK